MSKNGFNRNGVIGFTAIFLMFLLVFLAVYGATRLYYRSDDIRLVKNLNSKIVQQELLIKTLSINIAAANATVKSAVDEAQKLRRAHRWVGIFRSVLPECVDGALDDVPDKAVGDHLKESGVIK